jgi:D-alanyl-D-alanine carboxypeptidase/D-alanyl-D-alanine-endopeptidase (penicillin-binding protein 4)
VARLAASKKMGKRVAVVVAGTDGVPAYRSGPRMVTPASTLKTLTSLAALEALGPQHRFATTVVRDGRTLTLVGGGDPLLERRPDPDAYPDRADVRTLARSTAEALGKGGGRFRLTYDASLFTGPAVDPSWEDDYIATGVVSPISALWVDEGRDAAGFGNRVDDPAAEAARVFRTELQRAGVRVGPALQGTAPATAKPVAQVRSAPLVEVVQHVLEASDNEGAEVLLRHVAIARGRDASFVGGARAVREVLEGLGVRLTGLQMYDGSGLSRRDRIEPATLVDVLAHSLDPARPELAGVASGLPVAGFSGSLTNRFDVRADAGLGLVRAKTGTLTGVHGLAGVAVGRDGSVMLFAALADRVKEPQVLFARAQLDRIAAALAACRCGR